ncbi:ubiquitin-protein ligase E3 [Schizopora paradoxa]|uniref:GID complex catalytic subunit 2 n=1 Tax=Schizopora paradoxa TaxID=27342 RepID=A0A0H2S3H1_9AGAM|nr:ubiquitin-protein ligase E3 [Schizopora paradoxa]
MDAALKDLSKLENLTHLSRASSYVQRSPLASTSGKGKSTSSIEESLDGLLASLRDVKERLEAGTASEEDVANVCKIIEERKKEVDERQKEIYSTLGKVGKALDKKFTSAVPESPHLFTSEASQEALLRTVALHFLRTGQFSTAETFFETHFEIPEESRTQFVELHTVLTALRRSDIQPALSWCERKREFLNERGSPLEFFLHRSQFIRLLLASSPPNSMAALAYAQEKLVPMVTKYGDDIYRLLACLAYVPLSRLQHSPYADLASPALHMELEPMFATEYCASLGMSRQVPLRVVCNIGGGGALARIEKGRKVMRERKSEWSQTDELPIEIPLPPENRYHSIFACPVSKEQATDANPPMMMECGHVVAKDSLQKLCKPQGRVKCPYCPQESHLAKALQVYF